MRSGLTAAACIGAIALPAVALGGPPDDPEYGGKVDDKKNHYLGFDVKGSGNNRKIENTFIVNVPFHGCGDAMNNGKQSGFLNKAVNVKNDGSFDETNQFPVLRARGGEPSDVRYRLKGELDGNKASGFIDVDLLGTGGCTSGKQDFKVKKPSPPIPATDP